MKTTKEQVKELLETSNGRIFTVTFTKKDGSLRELNGRLGVTKHLKGGELAYKPSDYGLISVFDIKNKGYRMINLNTLKSLKINKETYEVQND